MIEVKPSETPPVTRYVIKNREGFYYDGHGYGPTASNGEFYPAVGEPGIPGFNTKNILFAVKYGDTVSIETLIKNHKKWCIDHNRDDLFNLFESCAVYETYT